MRELNILSFPLQPVSDQAFCSIGHRWFYLVTEIWAPSWNMMFAPFPSNARIINIKEYKISSPINWTLPMIRERYLEPLNIDLVLAPAIQSCYFALQWHYPTIQYANFIAADEYGRLWFRHLIKHHPEIPIVFVSEENARMSQMPEKTYQVIDRGWDIAEYGSWKGDIEKVLTVCTGLFGRSYFDFYSYYKKLAASLPLKLVGYSNRDLSVGKPNYLIKQEYSKYRVYFNIDPLSGRTIYEALASGIPVVSIQRNDALKQYIKNGVNAFMSNDVDYLIGCAKELLKNKVLAEKIGREGQKIIAEHFPISKYKESWNKLFYETVGVK